MQKLPLDTLQKFGLAAAEGQVYLALAVAGTPMRARTIAAATGVPRGSVYPALNALIDRGIVQNGQGYGSEFTALAPREALPRLIAAEKEKLEEAESLTDQLIKEIESKLDDKQKVSESNLIEVIRDPRVVSDRFQKLQRETKREIQALVKPPMLVKIRSKIRGNPAESESLCRGVSHRVIYESSVLEHENIAPFLKGWIEAGEEAREYKGTLPLKLTLFDCEVAWLPLETNAPGRPLVSVLIRHPALGQALRILFDHLWERSAPIRLGTTGRRKRGRRKEVITSSK